MVLEARWGLCSKSLPHFDDCSLKHQGLQLLFAEMWKIKRGKILPLLGYSWGEWTWLRTGPAAAPVRCAVRELTALRTEVCVCSSIHLASGLVLPWLPNFQTAAEALLSWCLFVYFVFILFMYVIHTHTCTQHLKKIACLCYYGTDCPNFRTKIILC